MTFLKNTKPSSLDDQQLVMMYKQSGNLDTLAQLYQRYMELSYAVCLKYLKDRESAQDAVLQVFEELVVKLKKHDPLHFRSWLYTVVKNHCLMQLRKAGHIKTINLEAGHMQFSAELHHDLVAEKELQLHKLTACIETLSEEQKMSVELFYLKEKCYKEIECITGLDFNKVRSLIQNGRRNLKLCMEKTGGVNNAILNKSDIKAKKD